jgi:hypothetical protein
MPDKIKANVQVEITDTEVTADAYSFNYVLTAAGIENISKPVEGQYESDHTS